MTQRFSQKQHDRELIAQAHGVRGKDVLTRSEARSFLAEHGKRLDTGTETGEPYFCKAPKSTAWYLREWLVLSLAGNRPMAGKNARLGLQPWPVSSGPQVSATDEFFAKLGLDPKDF